MNRLAGARTETFLGLHGRGFPNLFIVTGPQGGCGSFNYHDEYVRTPEGWKCQSLKVMGLFFTPHDSGWVKPLPQVVTVTTIAPRVRRLEGLVSGR